MAAAIDDAETEVNEDISEYLAMDLAPQGKLCEALLSKAPEEAESEEIALSDIIGNTPANLTAAMRDWYQGYIAPKRGAAISALIQMFSAKSATDKAEGFLLQLREGSLDEKLRSDKRLFYDQHNERFFTDTQKIRELHAKLVEARRRYEIRKAQVGQEAKLLNKPLYLGVLIFVIFGSEALINFEAFQALPWASPAIAWGSTILVGLAIGFAAHYHGTIYRQYAYHFGPAVDDTKRGPALRMFLGGCTALSLALGFVFYARSTYLASYMSSVGAFDQGGQKHSDFLWVVGGSLMGNLLVYFVGVLWAYFLHDADPQYVELRENIIDFQKSLDALEGRLEKARVRSLEQLNAIHRRDLEAARKAYSVTAGEPRFSRAHELFARVLKQDEAVVAVLEAYRTRLIQAFGSNAKKVQFIVCIEGPQIRVEHISPVQYQRLPIRLKYLEG